MVKRKTIELARQLRRNATKEEQVLWNLLRNRKFNGLKFNRQHPIVYNSNGQNEQFFVVDFYCAQFKLAIELDGKIHDFQLEYDKNRTLILNQLGIKVLRFKNEELKERFKLLGRIEAFIETHFKKDI